MSAKHKRNWELRTGGTSLRNAIEIIKSLNDKLQYIEMPLTSPNKNMFQLSRLYSYCRIPNISVDFRPRNNFDQNDPSIIPKYNKDSYYFTQAFVIPYYYPYLIKSQEKVSSNLGQQLQNEKEQFLKKVKSSLSPSIQKDIKFAPRESTYCSVCKVKFEQYWSHINSRSHRFSIYRNQGNKFIRDLCSKYKKLKKTRAQKTDKKKKQSSQKKTKKIKKTQKVQKEVSYCREDFIITLPKSLLSKQFAQMGNISTNGMISLQQQKQQKN